MWAVELKRRTFEKECQQTHRDVDARRRVNALLKGGDERVCSAWSAVTLSNAQETAAKLFLDGKRGVLCAMGLGTGKTLTAVHSVDMLFRAGKIDKALVVTKTSLVLPYLEACKQCMGVVPSYYDAVTTYTSLRLYPKRYEVDSRTVVVVDEVQNYRNYWSGKKKHSDYFALLQKTKSAGYVLLLSATPFVNRGADLGPAINFLMRNHGQSFIANTKSAIKWQNKVLLGNNQFESSSSSSSVRSNGPLHLHPLGTNDTAVVYDYTQTDFPRRVDHVMPIELSDRQYKAVKGIEKNIEEEIQKWLQNHPDLGDGGKPNRINAFMNKSRRLMNNIHLTAETTSSSSSSSIYMSPKVQALVFEFTKYALPAVVYSAWLESGVAVLQQTFQNLGYRTGVITGKETPTVRQQTVNAYNHKGIDILIISSAGGEGLNLKRTRQFHVFESQWNNAVLEQAIGRGIRRGSHLDLPEKQQQVDVFHWVSTIPRNRRNEEDAPQKTADERLREMSLAKQRQIDIFMDALRGMSENNYPSHLYESVLHADPAKLYQRLAKKRRKRRLDIMRRGRKRRVVEISSDETDGSDSEVSPVIELLDDESDGEDHAFDVSSNVIDLT